MTLFAEYEPNRHGDPDRRVRVRLARLQDVPAIARISAERLDSSTAEAQIRFERELANPATARTLWVAVVEGSPIGFGRATHREHPANADPAQPPSGWYLTGVLVTPAWRRRGAGRALTRARLRFLASEGERDVYFFVNATNGASLDLHGAMGFERTAEVVGAPGVKFTGGRGFLCRLDLTRWAQDPSR